VYRVDIRPQAEKDMQRLPPRIVRQLQEKIDLLAENPRPHDSKRVVTLPGLLRVASGEYRIIYEVDDPTRTVTVKRIRHRREAYR